MLLIKKDSTFFGTKRWNQFFFKLKQKVSPLSVLKNISAIVYQVEINRLVPLLTPIFFG